MDEKNRKILEENLERYAYFSKEDAELLKSIDCKRVAFCHNANGDLNLEVKTADSKDYVHSRDDIKQECASWFSSISDNTKILYVFGIGLGYYYDSCKEWLAKDPTRFLIFLEDDLEIIYHFLQTEKAREILHDSRVRLQYVDKFETRTGFGVDALTTAFIYDAYRFSSLAFYGRTREKFYNDLMQFFSHTIYSKQIKTGEFLTGSVAYYTNYYNNLKFLPQSYLGNEMFGKFQGVPAIICGAGPSLEKNIHLLKTCTDKALIIAGGSAINALNSYDIFPHFTAGIDPNPSQLMRMLSNTSFETPFFYRNRIFTEALGLNSGSKIYITGAGGYELHKWIEKKLGIVEKEPLDEGYNIINFSVSIAKNLGCNPIILCGVDLAYTNNQSYLSGMKFHPLHNFKKTFITKNAIDEVIGFKDINGNPTTTLWKWVNEATWYTHFAEQNRNTLLINATEGGIGFPNIQHLTLAEVAKKYVTKTFDFESMIHGEIQNSNFAHEINNCDVLKIMKLLRKSLGNCEQNLKSLMEEYAVAVRTKMIDNEESIEDSLKKIKHLKEELIKNDYFLYVLKRSSEVYHMVYEKRMKYFLYDLEKNMKGPVTLSSLELELDNYKFLKAVMKINKGILEQAIKEYPKETKILKSKRKQIKVQSKVKIDETSHEKHCEYYPHHAIKKEEYLQNGLLEGPSIFYSQTGNVLSRSWYEKNLREGEGYNYYLSGELFSKRNYKHGLQNGVQEYYFKDGSIKTSMNYTHGQLDGKVLLYYPDHKLKRELTFKSGKREGIERMWSPQGTIIIEAHYEDDKPVGVASWWYDNGVLRQKVTHAENVENYQIQCFAPDGTEISKELVEDEDYFDKLIKITNTFMTSIEGLFENATILMPLIEPQDADEIKSRKEQLDLLRIEVNKLIEINKTIKEKFSGNAHRQEEPFWKSKALQDKIDEQLNGVVDAMKKEIESVQNLIIKAMERIRNQNG